MKIIIKVSKVKAVVKGIACLIETVLDKVEENAKEQRKNPEVDYFSKTLH